DKENVVRELEAPTAAGLQRIGWDLRQVGANRFAVGRALAPGTYTIQLMLDDKPVSSQKLEVVAGG
ncbi:hypothetical protein, partial [Armatimonas sp.]|uniref:hypothetical protein n=1 Tax=Armatimonas sp. TaxID=1872638 RepID=UPI003752AD74